jgi:transposase
MDERLPLGSMDAGTLRMLLEKERSRQLELEQEIRRLGAGLARQNERIIELERENRELRQLAASQQQVGRGLEEQNQLLRQRVAQVQAEIAQLRGGLPPAKPVPAAWPSERTKQDTPPKPRRKRDRQHNRGRKRMAEVDERIEHAVETCPGCGRHLAGGWVHQRIQVIELPPPARVWVREHVLIRRRCPRCRLRVLPPAPAAAAGRIGQCRFGPRLLAHIATLATVHRMPLRQIRAYLHDQYGLAVSQGGLVGLLRQVSTQGTDQYEALKEHARASPVVHADETGWREDGIPGFIWTLATPTTCLFHRDAHRSGAVIDDLLGTAFGGTLVTDFYAAYDHLPGLKQRCWAHLWRDIDALVHEHPTDEALGGWVAGVRAIYDLATGPRPAKEEGRLPKAERARGRRARRYEQQLLALCPEDLAADRPEATLCKRIRRYLPELFTFVRDPAVPHTNNQAERVLRPLVTARKIAGGTRSSAGSTTRMVLASIAATSRLRGIDPAATFTHLLLDPSHRM